MDIQGFKAAMLSALTLLDEPKKAEPKKAEPKKTESPFSRAGLVADSGIGCPICGASGSEPCLATRGALVGQPLKDGRIHPGREVVPVPVEEDEGILPQEAARKVAASPVAKGSLLSLATSLWTVSMALLNALPRKSAAVKQFFALANANGLQVGRSVPLPTTGTDLAQWANKEGVRRLGQFQAACQKDAILRPYLNLCTDVAQATALSKLAKDEEQWLANLAAKRAEARASLKAILNP